MKIFIYGFRPFGKSKINITEEIIKSIPDRKELYKKVFKVEFDKKMFQGVVKRTKPDLIIGLGQCSRGNKIRIERRAQNIYNERKGNKDTKILESGPKYIYSNYKLKPGVNSYLSYDAGKYVCNYSMYLMAKYALENNIKFVYIHIPVKISADKASKFLDKIIESRDLS